jgi:type III pantothenate kinase
MAEPMRVIAVDVGNSRVKWGVWDDRWTSQGSTPTAQVDTLAAAWGKLPPSYAIYASSVAGPHVRTWLDDWARTRGSEVHWLTSRHEQCGVRNAYRQPSQLGTDRWASLIAAWHLVHGAALVINAGTAVTIDALDSDGVFRGGLILPGLALMASALVSGTAGLPAAPGAFAVFPDNTADAIASGALLAVGGAIDRMGAALVKCGAAPQIVLSGGAAPAIAAQLSAPVLSVPHLVLEGLRIVADAERA